MDKRQQMGDTIGTTGLGPAWLGSTIPAAYGRCWQLQSLESIHWLVGDVHWSVVAIR